MTKNLFYMPRGRHKIIACFRNSKIILYTNVKRSAVAALNVSLLKFRIKRPVLICADSTQVDVVGTSESFTWEKDGIHLVASMSGKPKFKICCACFLADCNFDKIVFQKGIFSFKEGDRGSRTNPAEIIGCASICAHFDNEPSFKKMLKKP